MNFYNVPLQNDIGYSNYVSEDFKQFYYYGDTWLAYRPPTLYTLYPTPLPIIQDPCYSGYTYNDPNFEGTYYGVSYTPTNQILFIYKQFNTDILFQSVSPPIPTFKTPINISTLILQTDLNNLFIGIKLDNLDDTNLLLTTN